jgi:hypothetical protein
VKESLPIEMANFSRGEAKKWQITPLALYIAVITVVVVTALLILVGVWIGMQVAGDQLAPLDRPAAMRTENKIAAEGLLPPGRN